MIAAATREEGLTVVPVCPYVKKWLTKHPEHEDITAAPAEASRLTPYWRTGSSILKRGAPSSSPAP